MRIPLILLAAGLAIISSGCTVLATGAATGAAVAHDRRTTGTLIEDQAIELKARSMLNKHDDIREQSHINVTSYNTQVLLSGEAPTDAMRQRISQIVEAVQKVRKVFNELRVAAPSSLLTRSSDSLLTAKVKASMLATEGLDVTRIKVVTENGTVFLMGLVSRSEADLATEITRKVGGVQRVVKLFEYVG